MHEGDVRAQFEETLRNLAALVAAACGKPDTAADALARIHTVRAYFAREEDFPFVQSALRSRLPAALEIELVAARLCRPELLVEIEGVADVGSPAVSSC
jgi:chorismate lyase/3-hydroxybenzoate synthase